MHARRHYLITTTPVTYAHAQSRELYSYIQRIKTSCMLTADINMQLSTTVLASIVFFATCCLQPAKAACNNDAPDYVAVDCRIAATNDTTCHSHRRPDGSVLDICNERTSCLVWTGMQLNISCGDEDMDSPFQNVYSTQGQGNFSWPFATKSAVQGVYTCIRNKDGAVISNRSVIVDGTFSD